MRHTTMRHAATALTGAIAAATLAFACATQAQQLYRWVDKDGRVTYSQTPPPPSAAKALEQRDVRGSVIEGGQMPYATQQAARDFPVVLYTTSDCGQVCKTAKEYLQQRGIPFRDVNAADEKVVAELKAATGKATVPTLTIGRDSLAGYDAETWKAALDTAGYPANAGGQASRPARAAASNRPLPQVRLYVTKDCGSPCASATQLLTQNKVRFESIGAEDAAVQETLRKIAGELTVPVLSVGSEVVRGFDTFRFEAALNKGGYVIGSAQMQGPDPSAGPRGRYAPAVGEPPVQAGRYAAPAGEAPAQSGRYLTR